MSGPTCAIIAKHCCALESDDRKKRRNALEWIRVAIFDKISNYTVEQRIQQVYKHVLRCFNDKAEICRELAVSIFIEIIQFVSDDNDQYLAYAFPVILQRIGADTIVEPSEEVRLALMHFIYVILNKFTVKLACYIDDMVHILSGGLKDPYPKIKKVSCDCASDLAKALPREFYPLSEAVITPILQSFTHQHSQVRLAAVKAIGNVVRYGNNKSVDVVVIPLAERLFDQNSSVRLATTEVVGMWLVDLPDRYSFFHRLIPIILTSLNDPLLEIREEAWKLWNNAGEKFLSENENDLRDEKDFIRENPQHYPPGVIRANLGCRSLIGRNIHKFLPGLVNEVDDWKVDIRIKSTQLLCIVILNCEQSIVHYLERILLGMYRASRDDDIRVFENVGRAAEYVGYFVPPETYCKLIIPTLEDSVAAGPIRIFAGVLRGSQRSTLQEKLHEIANFLQRPEVCQSKKMLYQAQILNCCDALMTVSQEDCQKISDQLFRIIITVLGLSLDNSVTTKATEYLEKLQTLNGYEKKDDLVKKHIRAILEELQTTAESWSLCTPERFIFEALLLHSGEVIGSHLDIIIPLLVVVLKPQNDPEMKVKVFTIISTLLHNPETLNLSADNGPLMVSFIKDGIIPNLIWHAGRTAEAIRTAAISCLYIMLQYPSAFVNNASFLESIANDIFPLLLTLIDDPSKKTRLFTLRTMAQFVTLLRDHKLFTLQQLYDVSPVTVHRLDDVDDEVRHACVKTMIVLLKTLPPEYDIDVARTILKDAFKGMITYLNDSDEDFQSIMLGALKEIAHVSPEIMFKETNSRKNICPNSASCTELLSYLENIIINKDVSDDVMKTVNVEEQ